MLLHSFMSNFTMITSLTMFPNLPMGFNTIPMCNITMITNLNMVQRLDYRLYIQ